MKNSAVSNAEILVLTEWEGKPASISFNLENQAVSIASSLKKKRSKCEPSEAQLLARQKFAEMARARSENLS